MKLTPEGHGWEDVELVIQGKRHRYHITEAYPDGFWAVVAALYVLYPRRDYSVREGEDDWDGFECLGEYKNGLYIYAPVLPKNISRQNIPGHQRMLTSGVTVIR